MTCGRSPLEYNGGIEIHVMEVSKRLANVGINVKILSTSTTCKFPQRYLKDRVTFDIFPAIAPFSYYFSIPQYGAIKTESAQILHAHGYQDFSFLASVLGRKKRQKLLITIHSGWPATQLTLLVNRCYRVVTRKLFERADKIIGVSAADLEIFGFGAKTSDSNKTAIIPNGVNFGDFANKQDLPSSIPENYRFVLSIGRLERYKGHHYVIEGFAKLKASKALNVDLKLVIVGSGSYRWKLEDLISRFKLQKDVFILSNLERKEIIGLYQKCAFFILLSQYESQCIAVSEAIAAGKPVLVSATSALKEYVKKGWCTSVPYPPQKDIVAAKMQELLERPNSFVARNVKLDSWDDVAKKLVSLYHEVLGH
jgi:glycosyltransferase involved in cell wall biosynthesis